MIGRADDTLVFCLVAAALVVIAHGIDALGARRGDHDREGWGHSLSLAMCGLAVVVIVVGVMMSESTTDLMVAMSTCAAVAVSALPLVGFGFGDGTRERPANPWDRAYRVRPARVAQLLSPTPPAAPTEPPTSRTPTTMSSGVREGVVMPSPQAIGGAKATSGRAAPTPAAATTSRSARSDAPTPSAATAPEVFEAEETLHDVSEVVGDLGRLLGLSPRQRRNG